ncbi:cytochrome b-245 light chain [Plakobranchus ocellatus]|uniref:Cytochrome b-245 light chain n=1 Tax=Plakobranchus ocellatus TaxID=259542 RepID=A0AAV4C0U0_9GAST|nr:cytochrome b-245 light chain [Plakobranchus ocellatus]
MGGMEWAIWANENAIASSVLTIIGGFLAVTGQYDMWQIGIYAIVIGFLALLLEYPRSKRKKGKHDYERRYQYVVTVIVMKGGLFTRNYFIRFVFYLVISVPCCFILQTVLGASCLIITSFIYLAAGVKGEEWQPIPLKKDEQGPKVIAEPTRPPPRRPDTTAGGGDQLRVPQDSRV